MAEDNQARQFLSAEEYKILDGLIGDKHQSLIAVHARLYITDFETEPRKKEGVLSIVINLKNDATTFQMYSLETNLFLWSKNTPEKQEEYVVLEDELHLFKPEDSLFHFKFLKDEEGKAFKDVIYRIQLNRRSSEKVPIKGTLELKNNQKSISKFSKSESDLTSIDTPHSKEQKPKRLKAGLNLKSKFDGELRKEKKRLKKIKKEDIGLPFDFRHLSHIGWDASEAFGEALLDPQLKQFLARAGISETQLRDPETRDFIHEFIEAHGGIETVKKEMNSDAPKERPPSSEIVKVLPPPPPPPELEIRSDEDKQQNIVAAKPPRKTPPYLQNLKTKIADSPRFRQVAPNPPLSPSMKADSLDSPLLTVDLTDEKPEVGKSNAITVDSIRRPETVYYSSLPREKKGTFAERFSLNTPAGKPRIVRPAPPLPTTAAKSSELQLPRTTSIAPDLPVAPNTKSTELQVPPSAGTKESEQEGPIATTTENSEPLAATARASEPSIANSTKNASELLNKEVTADDVFTKSDSQSSLFIEEKDEIPVKEESAPAPPPPRPVPAPRKKSSQPP